MVLAAWMVLAAIAAAVLCGYKKAVNVTALATVLALFIGYGMLGLSVKEILESAPLSVMFDMFAVTFFFGYALDCGAFSAIVDRILYSVRRHPRTVMPLLFLLSFLSSAIGPGIMAAGFMAPLAFDVDAKAGCSPFTTFSAVVCGVIPGSNFIRSSGGAAIAGMLQAADGALPAQRVSLMGFFWSLALCALFFLFAFLLDRNKAGKADFQLEPPKPLSAEQKKSCILVALVTCVSILPSALKFLTGISLFPDIIDDLGIGTIMMAGICAASVLRLGKDHKVLTQYVPWGTITMLCSMSILVSVGKSAGMVQLLSGWISDSVPPLLITPLLAAIAGFMSMFSSAIGVVISTLFVVVPELAADTGLNAQLMYAAIMTAATLTGSSPLSTVGGMTWGSSGAHGESLFYKILPVCFLLLLMTVVSTFFLSLAIL